MVPLFSGRKEYILHTTNQVLGVLTLTFPSPPFNLMLPSLRVSQASVPVLSRAQTQQINVDEWTRNREAVRRWEPQCCDLGLGLGVIQALSFSFFVLTVLGLLCALWV